MGNKAIAGFCAQYYIAAPDIVFKTWNLSITIYSNGESVIECDGECSCSKIYEIEGLPEGGDKKVIISSVMDELGDKLSSVQLTSSTAPTDGKGSATITAVKVGAAQEGKVFTVKMKMSFHLNRSNKIYLIIATYD